LDVPFGFFFHEDLLSMNPLPYLVKRRQTLDHQDPTTKPSILLDIDVLTVGETPTDLASIETRLREMRWLKNKTFFGSLMKETIEGFRHG